MTVDEAKRKALADYEAALGSVISITCLMVNVDSTTREYYAPEGRAFQVKILPSPADGVTHQNDEFIDPYWDVAIIDGAGVVPQDIIDGDYHPWIDGPSYETKGEA